MRMAAAQIDFPFVGARAERQLDLPTDDNYIAPF
jgi:hypothetical protein